MNSKVILKIINFEKSTDLIQSLIENMDITTELYHELCPDRNEFRCMFTANNTQIFHLENYLDDMKKIYPSLRYNLLIYDLSSKWPSSIRINKKGRKIYTKRMTKLGIF